MLSLNEYDFTNDINNLFTFNKFVKQNMEILIRDININILKYNEISNVYLNNLNIVQKLTTVPEFNRSLLELFR